MGEYPYNHGRLLDGGDDLQGAATLRAMRGINSENALEQPRMFTVLSEARRRLMLKVMDEPRTINELSKRLHRHRSSVTKDVGLTHCDQVSSQALSSNQVREIHVVLSKRFLALGLGS